MQTRHRPSTSSLLLFGVAIACGPSVADELPELSTGFYRAEVLDVAGTCDDAGVGYAPESDVVPLRAGDGWLELPEEAAVGGSIGEHAVLVGIPAFRMQRMERDASGYALVTTRPTQSSVHGPGLFTCGTARSSWSVTVLDEDALHATYDGSYCQGDPEAPQVCAVTIETEYTLVDACDAPCTIVDDRDTSFPSVVLGDDVLVRPSRCAC